METSKKRVREVDERYYSTLLNALTLDQLKTALFRLKRNDAPSVRSRSDAIEAIESAGWVESELISTLLDIEARSPTRHSAISKFLGEAPRFEENQLFQYFEPTLRGLQFRPVFQLDEPTFHSITFEHDVEVREWRDEDEDTRRLLVTKIRHPIVVRFYKDLNVAAFYFPGFSQGTAQKATDRLVYEDVIGGLADVLTYKFGTSFSRFPIAGAVKLLQEGDSPEIKVIRADMEAGTGRVSLDSPIETNSVSDLLFSFLRPHVSAEVFKDLRSAVGAAIDSAHSDYFVIYWSKEKVVTRVRLWSFACELMFVWNGTESSFRSIDAIIQLLVGVAYEYEKPSSRNLWEFVLSLPPDQVLTQSELIERGAQRPEDGLTLAVRGVQAGILKYVFRLKTSELILERPNAWSSDPSVYRRLFTLYSGGVIDGNDPRMIEVGFVRAGKSEEADA